MKAVIPIAGLGSRMIPTTIAYSKSLIPILNKPTINYLIEECVKAEIDEIIFIISEYQTDVIKYLDFSSHKREYMLFEEYVKFKKLCEKIKFNFIVQDKPRGLGHAICLAHDFINDDYFCVLLGDNPVLPFEEHYGIGELIKMFEMSSDNYLGIVKVPIIDTNKYGIITGEPVTPDLFAVCDIIEKPTCNPPSDFAVMGRYILNKKIFDILKNLEPGVNEEIQLTDGIKKMLENERVFGAILKSKIYDVGNKIGFVKSTIDFALKEEDIKEEIFEYIKKLI